MLNFSRYLDRLGLKTTQQPILLDTVQPVAIVGDLASLVSKPLWCGYLVGGTFTPGVLVQAAMLVVTPVPLRVSNYTLAPLTGSSRSAIEIGQPGTAPPVLTNPVALTPQRFQSRLPDAVWTLGEPAALPANGLPSFAHAVNTNFGPRYSPFYVPAGGWALISYGAVNVTVAFFANVNELPAETV